MELFKTGTKGTVQYAQEFQHIITRYKQYSFKANHPASPTQRLQPKIARLCDTSGVYYESVILVVLLAVEDPENRQEEVQDVKVEADGGGDFLLDLVVADDQLTEISAISTRAEEATNIT